MGDLEIGITVCIVGVKYVDSERQRYIVMLFGHVCMYICIVWMRMDVK